MKLVSLRHTPPPSTYTACSGSAFYCLFNSLSRIESLLAVNLTVFVLHDLPVALLFDLFRHFPSTITFHRLSLLSVPASALVFACLPQDNRLCMALIHSCNIFKNYRKIHFFLSYPPFSNTIISWLLFDHLWVLFCVTSSSHLFFHSHVSPPVGAGCARRPSSISLTCRSTPNRTQRPNLTSVLTVTSHSPTPATWPSTSVSTAGPSPTPAPTARNLSGNSVIYSSTHGTSDDTTLIAALYHVPVWVVLPSSFGNPGF